MPVGEMSCLDPDLAKAVIKNGIKTFSLVQSRVIPALLTSSATGFLYRAGYHPSDICVSAPTGSDKTLAFVLPIVQTKAHVFQTSITEPATTEWSSIKF